MLPLAVISQLLKGILLLASYISGSRTFPQPLEREEERKYLELLDEGDEKARRVLIERNLRLVAHIVKKFDRGQVETDDLISIGTIGLIKAINTFDPAKNTRLATYAARCIENEILMFLRSSKGEHQELMLQDPIGSDQEGNEITLLDILGTDPDLVAERVELNIETEKLYEKLDQVLKSREKRVLEMRYGLVDGIQKTQQEIAKMLGISRSYVSRIEKRAKNKLHRAFC